jgi:hypothetical protein
LLAATGVDGTRSLLVGGTWGCGLVSDLRSFNGFRMSNAEPMLLLCCACTIYRTSQNLAKLIVMELL